MALRADTAAVAVAPLVVLGGFRGALPFQLAAGVPTSGPFSLLAVGQACLDALRIAGERGSDVQVLILVSPPPPPADLPAVATLVVCGTDDVSATGRAYRERMANCHYVLVYACGADVAGDRPEAFAALVSDFLARKERFIVSQRSGLLHP